MAQQKTHYEKGCKLGREIIFGKTVGKTLSAFRAAPCRCAACEKAAAKEKSEG